MEELRAQYENADAFTAAFGVSEDELKRNGVDPAEFARKHANRALRSDYMSYVWSQQPQSEQAKNLSGTWALRCYKLMFSTIGLLILSTLHPFRPYRVILLSLSVVGLCGVMFSLFKVYALRLKAHRLKNHKL